MGDNGKAKKRGPEFLIKLPSQPSRLRRETPFICNVRFKNDLPEVPCDPKMLLPPLVPQELAAFHLTSLEREMKRDMLFEPDLGIPISMLDIERYTIPYPTPQDKPALHPKDAELLKDEEGEGAGFQRSRLRGSAAELSWLLRTKYITNEGAEQARRAAAREAAARRAAEEALLGEGMEGAIAAIERSFDAAQQVPVHPTNPSLQPVEVLPVFPDEELEGRTLVLALFDNDPASELDRLQRLPESERQRLAQAAQLKSFAQQRADGKVDRFVAYLMPKRLRPVEAQQQSDAIPAEALQTDYEWVREYDQSIKFDAKDQTYLFRFAGDHVGYKDLNTKLMLKKRKRQQFSDEGDEDFVPPAKVVLRLPGNLDLEDIEDENSMAAGKGGAGNQAAAAAATERRRLAKRASTPASYGREADADWEGAGLGGAGDGPQDRAWDGETLPEEADQGAGGADGAEGGSPVVQQQQGVLRDVFGDDDDDL
ncbi:hypothetical protein N2152v2_010646 [Parachlorella kessleri]